MPQGAASQPFKQRVSQPREQLPELVGPPAMAGRAPGKQIQLLILDPVLHVAPRTVELVVQVLIRLRQVGHHEAGVGTQAVVLGLDDDPSRLVPAAGAIVNRSEQALLVTGQLIPGFGQVDPRRRLGLDPVILGQPDDIAHVVALAPAQDLPATKAAVAPEDDLHVRPVAPKCLDQQRQDGPGVTGRIAVAAA